MRFRKLIFLFIVSSTQNINKNEAVHIWSSPSFSSFDVCGVQRRGLRRWVKSNWITAYQWLDQPLTNMLNVFLDFSLRENSSRIRRHPAKGESERCRSYRRRIQKLLLRTKGAEKISSGKQSEGLTSLFHIFNSLFPLFSAITWEAPKHQPPESCEQCQNHLAFHCQCLRSAKNWRNWTTKSVIFDSVSSIR